MTDTTVENTKQQQNSINQMKQRDICGERSGRATGKIRGLKQSVTKDSKYWGCDETKAAALSHQRDQGRTCKKLCKDKAHRAQERLFWGDCKKPITEGLKHMSDKHLSRRTHVLLILPSSYRILQAIL